MEIEKLSDNFEKEDNGISIQEGINQIKNIIEVIKQGKALVGMGQPMQQLPPQPAQKIIQPAPKPQPVEQPPQPAPKPQPTKTTADDNIKKIIGALDLVKTFKGDIKISELQIFLTENSEMISKFF